VSYQVQQSAGQWSLRSSPAGLTHRRRLAGGQSRMSPPG